MRFKHTARTFRVNTYIGNSRFIRSITNATWRCNVGHINNQTSNPNEHIIRYSLNLAIEIEHEDVRWTHRANMSIQDANLQNKFPHTWESRINNCMWPSLEDLQLNMHYSTCQLSMLLMFLCRFVLLIGVAHGLFFDLVMSRAITHPYSHLHPMIHHDSLSSSVYFSILCRACPRGRRCQPHCQQSCEKDFRGQGAEGSDVGGSLGAAMATKSWAYPRKHS